MRPLGASHIGEEKTGLVAGLKSHLHAAGAANSQFMALATGHRKLIQEASLMAYVDVIKLLGNLSLLCVPILLLFQRARRERGTRVTVEE